jgi:hypothetical protein
MCRFQYQYSAPRSNRVSRTPAQGPPTPRGVDRSNSGADTRSYIGGDEPALKWIASLARAGESCGISATVDAQMTPAAARLIAAKAQSDIFNWI